MAGALTAAIASIFSGSAVTADPYFEYTTLLLPGNGTNGAQNNTFLDGSTNNFTITRNGNTTQGTFSPFSQTGWGGYASATGQYLTAATSTAFDPGSSNFTVEAWIYPTALNTYNFIYTRDGATNAASQIAFGISSTGVLYGEVYVSSTAYTASSSAGAIVTNRWTHVAFVRNGTTTYLYVDGVQNGTNTGLSTSSINTVSIAANILNQAGAANRGMQGYCSNFRLVIGVAVYTGAFTPSTSPLAATQSSGTNISAITGTQTKILTFQSNRFIDNSVANSGAGWTLTVNGSLSVVAFSPFNPTASWSAATYGGSGYFDGSGDSLTCSSILPATSDFTLSFWVYPTSLAGYVVGGAIRQADSGNIFQFFIGYADGHPAIQIGSAYADYTAGVIKAGQWQYIQVVKSSSAYTVYVNGTALSVTGSSGNIGTTSIASGTFYVQYNTGCYFSDVRVVTSALSNTVPTAPLTAITNTSLLLNFTNAGIYDATSKNDLETVVDAQISTAQYKFPPSSMAFDGTGDYLTNNNASNSLLAFGTGDFTIEGWFYSNNASSAAQRGMFQTSDTIGGLKTSYTTGVSMNHGSTGELSVNVGSTVYTTSGASITTGAWFYFAITRSSGNVNVYVNGVSRASGSGNTNNLTGTYISVGGYYNTSYLFDGYLQDLRITKGYARTITASPTAAFPTL